MAQAKRKNTIKPSRLPRTDTQIYKQALPRMEYIIDTLATCVVADAWHESWESGPMPKRAADVMAYLRARAGGARENVAQEEKVNSFIAHCGQSLDWIFDGDPRGMICRAAGHSPQAASLPSIEKAPNSDKHFSNRFSELEPDLRDLRRAARLAALQLDRAVGELSFVDGKYTEVPDAEHTELAILAVGSVLRMAQELERMYDEGFTQPPPDTAGKAVQP
jgi:hypothetical protein